LQTINLPFFFSEKKGSEKRTFFEVNGISTSAEVAKGSTLDPQTFYKKFDQKFCKSSALSKVHHHTKPTQ